MRIGWIVPSVFGGLIFQLVALTYPGISKLNLKCVYMNVGQYTKLGSLYVQVGVYNFFTVHLYLV